MTVLDMLTPRQLRLIQKSVIAITALFALERIKRKGKEKIEEHFQTRRGTRYNVFRFGHIFIGVPFVIFMTLPLLAVLLVFALVIFLVRKRACADKMMGALVDAGVDTAIKKGPAMAASMGPIPTGGAASNAESGNAAAAGNADIANEATKAVVGSVTDMVKEYALMLETIRSLFAAIFNKAYLLLVSFAISFGVLLYVLFAIFVIASKLHLNLDDANVVKTLHQYFVTIYTVVVLFVLFMV
jgi:hypothetical protein